MPSTPSNITLRPLFNDEQGTAAFEVLDAADVPVGSVLRTDAGWQPVDPRRILPVGYDPDTGTPTFQASADDAGRQLISA